MLRFNFRGVNLSEGEYAGGVGEVEDARVALSELHARYPDLPLLAAGFSFGSRIVLRLAASDPAIRRVIAAGFPTHWPDRDFVYQVATPKYFVQSTQDEYGPQPDMEAFYDSAPPPKQIDWIAAGDHFFRDGLDSFESAIERIGKLRSKAT